MSADINVREKQEASMNSTETTHDRTMFSPVVDIWETDTGLVLVADLPGVTPDNLSVDLSDSILTINGLIGSEVEGRKSLIQEYEVGNFYRQFTLAEGLNQSAIAASLKEGVLKLVIPRLAPAQPRKIEIRTIAD
ncbi:MAG: hypothetical protein AMR96_02605 [Candidatus Adiutrix intracellularis]|jgi:HSP20 family protein|nr:MAG: hypothetical protein AMR96_02605 [Candidatus Adiutrix intracellularis]MDR2827222.1 Hsp20/alpha crystallin family protein [Candidatus Adiutrix intracellularis]